MQQQQHIIIQSISVCQTVHSSYTEGIDAVAAADDDDVGDIDAIESGLKLSRKEGIQNGYHM